MRVSVGVHLDSMRSSYNDVPLANTAFVGSSRDVPLIFESPTDFLRVWCVRVASQSVKSFLNGLKPKYVDQLV